MATKKSGGSSRNGRDSAGRRLGIKNNHYATCGAILVRQRGTTFHPGVNVYMGKDHTLHAEVSGLVHYSYDSKNSRKYINILNSNS